MKLILIIASVFYLNIAQTKEYNSHRYKHVIFIGVDGFGSKNYKKVSPSSIPNINFIKNNGAWTLKAKIDIRAFSGPNWMGMLTGSHSPHHGVETNNCENGKGLPTIFEVVREQLPDAEIGLIYDWTSIGCYPKKASLNHDVVFAEGETEKIGYEASRYIKEKRPNFLFVYFTEIDHAGHHSGKGNSPEYNKAVENSDKAIGNILKAINEAKMTDDTLVIFSSDHGHGTVAGNHSWTFAPVPLFFMGNGVKKGKMRSGRQIRNNFIAPLISKALGIQSSPEWDFLETPLSNYLNP